MIEDNELSAFLDSELPEARMEEIRELIATDDALAERLEALAMTDAMLNQCYREIDEQPMPESVLALLQEAPTSPTESHANVIAFPLWKRVTSYLPGAVAACFMIAIGYGVATLPGSDSAAALSNALAELSSGQRLELAKNQAVQVNFSFSAKNGQYCRQFSYIQDGERSENLACLRGGGDWKIEAKIPVGKVVEDGYVTASGPGPIDKVIDGMIAGNVFSPDEEQQLIQRSWKEQ